jgi:hypothetical protein
MKNAVNWNFTLCTSCSNQRFGATYHLQDQDDILFIRSVLRLQVTLNVVPSSHILITLMMEALLSSQTSVLKRTHGEISRKTAFFTIEVGLQIYEM